MRWSPHCSQDRSRSSCYEAPIHLRLPPGHLEHLEQLAEEGRYEDLLLIAFKQDAGLSDEEINVLRASPTWEERVAIAATGPRELRAVVEYDLDPQRFARLSVPVLILTGSKTQERFAESIRKIETAVRGARTVVLEGQGHVAHVNAPATVAQVLIDFFRD